jgi:hypothetical protein
MAELLILLASLLPTVAQTRQFSFLIRSILFCN